MAPPPEYDKEPKAPDKSATNISTEDSKLLNNLVNDQHTNSDHRPTNTVTVGEAEKKHVETLDDGQLKALLDEAINYKNPKDREGKSKIFKELLEKAEQESEEQGGGRAGSGCRVARRAAGRRGPPLPHSNSLQDLVAALAAEPPRKHHARHHPPNNVSARAHHGGSLPSGVDTSSLSEEPARGAGYLATVRCVNPPPLAERRVSASDANAPAEMELLHRRSKPMFPMTYTARATLEIGSGAVCSGRAVTTTTSSNQVDSAISFSCITTPEVVANCNTTSSTSQSTLSADTKSRSVTSTSSYNGLPLSRPNYGSTSTTGNDDYKKSLDENGNSVQGFSSPLSGSSQHKKPRRKKSSKNETVIDCQQIDGYQGDKNVEELLRFIESNADHGRAAKLQRVKHKDDSDDKGGKKRSAERRKDKESKIKRATSLEELSRTKIEDLTDATEAPLRPDKKERRDHAHGKERRSWGDDARDSYDAHTTELTDFQTVTKKRKPRRRTDERDPPRRTRPPSPRARRESAPPSDRSNDSNDDMDSVHSSPDVPRAPPATTTTLPAPSTHASYAEIARTRHNIPDLIESCNFYAEGEGGNPAGGDPAGAPADVDGYPALEARTATTRRRDAKTTSSSVRRERKESAGASSGPAEECPAPDVVGERRPAVILVDGAGGARDMDGVTFGFDINEQLLEGGARCDLVLTHVSVRAGDKLLRYVPPAPQQHLINIVQYVSTAWEDVVRSVGGKARYYTE